MAMTTIPCRAQLQGLFTEGSAMWEGASSQRLPLWWAEQGKPFAGARSWVSSRGPSPEAALFR